MTGVAESITTQGRNNAAIQFIRAKHLGIHLGILSIAWLPNALPLPIHVDAFQQCLYRSTQMVKNTFRKYHRLIATLFGLPLLFTALTGISVAIADTWLHQEELAAFLMKIHTYQIFKLDAILPVLNGLGLVGLVATGLSMTGLFARRHQPRRIGERS
jgi:hypothetical protein